MATRFLGYARRNAPRWLTEGEGKLVWASIEVVIDAFVERLRLGLRARFPSLAPFDALRPIGRDRRIERGIGESDTSFAARLITAPDDWRIAGNAFALMRQLRGYVNVDMLMRTVDCHGTWFTVAADGTRSWLLDQGNWDWDGDGAVLWARYWAILYPPTSLWEAGPLVGDADLWGGAVGTDGYTVGSTATPDQVATVKRIAKRWKPAGVNATRVVIAFDDTDFDPTDSAPPLPDGDWDIPSNRNPDAAYWNPNT